MEHKEYMKIWRKNNPEKIIDRNKKYRETHQEEIKEYRKKYYKENREEILKKKKAKRLEKEYGITEKGYKSLLDFQEGCCAICGEIETSKLYNIIKRLAVDHDHKTGKVRGLLCSSCNMALGGFNDDIKTLKKAIKYLKVMKDTD